MERLYSVIAKEYNSIYFKYIIPAIGVSTVSGYWGPCGGMVGGLGVGDIFLVISWPKVSKYAKFEKCHFRWDTALKVHDQTKILIYNIWKLDKN